MIKYPLNVTIDTNIFEANKFDFGTDSTLSLLVKNVQNGKIKLVLSDIVIREVEKHIYRRVENVCGKARKLRKEYLDILPEQYLVDIGMEIYVQIPNKEEVYNQANNVFYNFLEDCKVERLDIDSINLETIIEDYFSVRPPFENSERKRKEFPDAFIAQEIKNHFGSDEIVAIISQDKGFKKACGDNNNYLFFNSLGELFNTLNKSEEEYAHAIEIIKSNDDHILCSIKEMIDDSCVDVRGLTYDRDGVVDGYDYDETFLDSYSLSGMKIHTVDDIDEDSITTSLWIYGNMAVNCYCEDIDNAAWDSEEEEYIFVELKHILEKHNMRFPCRIELNKKTKKVRVLPFKIVLGQDSRKSRIEIDDEQENMYRDLEDAEREELGFLPLSQYADWLEDNLNESSMAQILFKLFERYNTISSGYEELASEYDEVITKIACHINEEFEKKIITSLSFVNSIPIDFSEKDNTGLMDKIKRWLDCKYEFVSDKMERSLPDYIEYGENISILGAHNKVYILSFDELQGNPEAGSEEHIEVSLLNDNEVLAKGYVKLTVGYLNFDEDGGASDGIGDSIDYEMDSIFEALRNLLSDLEDEFGYEQKLIKTIKDSIDSVFQ